MHFCNNVNELSPQVDQTAHFWVGVMRWPWKMLWIPLNFYHSYYTTLCFAMYFIFMFLSDHVLNWPFGLPTTRPWASDSWQSSWPGSLGAEVRTNSTCSRDIASFHPADMKAITTASQASLYMKIFFKTSISDEP